jgi:hypothetical protein
MDGKWSIPKAHKTPELRFRALLNEDDVPEVELMLA